MRVLPSRGYVLKTDIFSNPRRILGYVLVLFVLAAIPFTYFLANQVQNVQQNAASGNPACLFIPATVRPGEAAELLIAGYPYKIPPYVDPSSGYVMTGQNSATSFSYQFNTPRTTWTASLLDPGHPLQNGKPNKLASCTISTSNN